MKSSYCITVIVIVCSLALSGCGKSDPAATITPAATMKPAVIDPQAGITSMLDASVLFKNAVDAKDAAKVKEIGPLLEASWASFEDYIKPNYPDYYLKVEDSLSPLTSGAEQDQPDFVLLSKVNDALSATLKQMSTDLAKK